MQPIGGASAASARPTGSFAAYLTWNAAIVDVVYGGESAGIPVFLDLEDEILQQIAERCGYRGHPRTGLVAAAQATLNRTVGGQSAFADHLRMLANWDRRGREAPPVIGLLALLALAALDMREGDGFAANNYYDRLMPLLGIDAYDVKSRVIESYRDCSARLWNPLNDWLLDWEGERGLPTAYTVNRAHAHVGRPLSQALLRATDREHLTEFFSELELPPRTRLADADMEVLLDEWIDRPITPASQSLRRLWSAPEARERITSCACQLLEAWSGASSRASEASGARRLYLSAMVRGFPTASIEFNLLGAAGAEVGETVELQLADMADRLALPIEHTPGGRWRLADPSALDPQSMLAGAMQLEDRSGAVFTRRPRRLVPLRKDTLLHAYVEAGRVPLGEMAVLLCKDELAGAVSEALAHVARPGWSRRADLSGCPAGWAIFGDVQVLGDLPHVNPATGHAWRFELNLLQPIASSQVSLEGGLHLPGRLHRWSSLSAPEVVVVSETRGALQIHLGRPQAVDSTVLHSREFAASPAVWPLQSLNLHDGDYQVVVVSATDKRSAHSESRSLRLRSTDTEKGEESAPILRRMLDRVGDAVIGAADRGHDVPYVRGPAVEPAATRTLDERNIDFAVPSWWWERQAPRAQTTYGARAAIRVPSVPDVDCFHTGAHHIQLPTFYGKRTSQLIVGVCRHCGLAKRYPTRLGRQREGKKPIAKVVSVPKLDVEGIDPVASGQATTMNVAYDAMCYLGSEYQAHLQQIAVQVDPSPLFVDAFVRGLETLGHIEVERHHRTFTAGAWEVVPPMLVGLPSGSFVLVGRRSKCLTEILHDLATDRGAEIDVKSQTAAPERIRLQGLTIDDAGLLAAEVSEQTSRHVRVVPNAARALAAVLPPLSTVLRVLPHQAVPGFRSAKRWNRMTARWEPAAEASLPGAFQLASAATTIYCIRDETDIENGTMRHGDARVVKHVEALLSRERLVGYDEASHTMYMPLGAELPLLYGRAAILASGLVPDSDPEQGLVSYRSIPPILLPTLFACSRADPKGGLLV